MAATTLLGAPGSPSTGTLASTVFGVVTKPQTWRNVLYLALAFPLGLTWFICLTVGIALGAGLAVIGVGLLILVATMIAWRMMASLERLLARRLLGVAITEPFMGRTGTPWERLRDTVRDPVTWKSLVFVVARFPLGIVALVFLAAAGGTTVVLLFAPLITTTTPVTVFGWRMDDPLAALAAVPVGVVAGIATLHAANGLCWLQGLLARVMLGPATVELHRHVEDLRDARARIIAAGDAERRRLERDLHDGAQQRLVALSLTLHVARNRMDKDPEGARELIDRATDEAQCAVRELRELARGIHPALLAERGLGPALEALATRAPIPVDVTGVPEARLPDAVEAALYFSTAEALTNVAKYARAESASVRLSVARGRARLEVEDDGVGGADTDGGTGLRGLRDRVEALDGHLDVISPEGHGTLVVVEIPVERW